METKKIVNTHVNPWDQLNTSHVVQILKLTPHTYLKIHNDQEWNIDIQKNITKPN